jgi:signal transduction histidine kinase
MDVVTRLARQAGTGAEIGLVAAMTMGVIFIALITFRPDAGWEIGLGVGITICAAAVVRGRNRALAAVAGLAAFTVAGLAAALAATSPGPLFGGGLAGLLVLGAAAARRLPPLQAAFIGLAGTLVIAVSETAGPAGLFDHRVLWALAGTTLWFGALASGVYLRYLDFLHRQTLREVRRQERLELARELHDVAAHHVTGIIVQAQAARFTGTERSDRLLSALGSIETAGSDTLAAIRQLVGLLREPDDAAGVTSEPEPIGQLVQRFAEHGPAVDLRMPPGLPVSAWPPEVASTVYRVVQEALTNIARHAPAARSVTVTISHDAEQVGVEVTDDAPAAGSRHSRPGGYGLVGMRERVEAIGGKLHAGPLGSAGWAVRASLPVPARGQP